MKYKIFAILIVSISLWSCKDDEPEVALLLPSNLSVELTLSDDDEGLVSVKATANNENFYTIRFEDGDNTEVIESTDGIALHQYTSSGLYTIITKAHTTVNDLIQSEDTITVTITSTTNQNGIPVNGFISPLTYNGYTLVWNEEFSGNQLDESSWNYEIGTGSSGWGNNELQYYQRQNASVQNGYLTIEVKRQAAGGSQYTSSRITTLRKQSFKYGRIDIRAAMPKGQGLWPALWMLGDQFTSSGWPSCGEIDIMEMVGGTSNGKSDRITHGTLHWDNFGNYASFGGKTSTTKKDLNEEFHVYSIIWDSQGIKWLLDDRQFHEISTNESHMNEFQEKFFFIFNVAVGGNWPGSPDQNTVFPQKMHVDYVRVFQK
jgi:hypothetical protein